MDPVIPLGTSVQAVCGLETIFTGHKASCTSGLRRVERDKLQYSAQSSRVGRAKTELQSHSSCMLSLSVTHVVISFKCNPSASESKRLKIPC